MNGSELDGFASSYGILRRPCETDESLRQKVVHAMSRPKPARVEKWQRWRWEDRPEFIVGLVEQDHNVSTVDHCHVVSAYANDMLVHVGWHFLGYTKPDKIEVGQRWRTPGVERPREVAAIMDGGLTLRFADGGALPCGTLLEYSMFEYLGMAPRSRRQALRRTCSTQRTPIHFEQPRQTHDPICVRPTSIEVGQRWRWSGETFEVAALREDGWFTTAEWQTTCEAVLASGRYLGMAAATSANTIKIPRPKAESTEPIPMNEEALPKGLYPDRYESLKEAMSEPGEVVVPSAQGPLTPELLEKLRAAVGEHMVLDPKTEPRRANELAAKQLIENPPEWAYPRAWMCAVLAALEGAPRISDDDRQWLDPLCKRAHNHEHHALCDASDNTVPLHAYNAYARGMEKPAGFMQRPKANDGSRGAGDVMVAKARNEMRRM